MKILYLTDQTYLHGGIEKVLSQKANYFADVSNDEVLIITYNQGNNKACYPISKKIRCIDLGIDYEEGISYFHLHHLKKMPRHYKELRKAIQKLDPDIIISSSFGPDFYFLPYIEKQIPKIKEFHSSRYFYNSYQRNTKAKILHYLSTFIENKYDQLVVLNESERNFYKSGNVTIIPNAAEITGERANYSSKKIMAAGRISPVKNFGEIIYSFSQLHSEYPEWELHFFGEDYLETQKKLQLEIKEYRLQNHVYFKGSVKDLKKEMQNYSIYAMTSETECFPMVLLESLSVGLPVISYDSPTGPRHILTDCQDSFLIPYKNLDIFTEKLRYLMEDENFRERMGAKGLENINYLSIGKVMRLWKDLFTSLLTP